jgi:hypothetical protein
MSYLKIGCLFFCLAMAYVSCRKPYEPPVDTINTNFLVVEGFINTGNDSTIIKLSRTVPISEKGTIKPELRALLVIESENNTTYRLNEFKGGVYGAAPLNLDPNQKYRLRITTTSGSSYLSDFVESKNSPLIDSISWEAKDDGVQIYSNTHDDAKKSVYYRWEYEETWQFTAQYSSSFIAEADTVNFRNPQTQDIYRCWGNSNASTIVLGSSEKLDKDVIHLNPVTFIRSDSEKVMTKYSILVKQYALTKEAFDFWQTLKKNTESLGSIFDAQPSQLTGNIKNIDNPAEPVLGYVSAGTVQKKRIFISDGELPNWRTAYPFACSPLDTIWLDKRPGIPAIPPGVTPKFYWENILNLIPVDAYSHPESGKILAYLGASPACADCTIRGTNKRPEYWQ